MVVNTFMYVSWLTFSDSSLCTVNHKELLSCLYAVGIFVWMNTLIELMRVAILKVLRLENIILYYAWACLSVLLVKEGSELDNWCILCFAPHTLARGCHFFRKCFPAIGIIAASGHVDCVHPLNAWEPAHLQRIIMCISTLEATQQ